MWRWEGEDVRVWEGEGYIREYQMISYLTIMAVPPLPSPPLPSPLLTIMAAFLLVVVTKPMASSWSGENLESPEANCRRCRMSMYMDVLCVCSTSTSASLEGVRVWGCGCEDVGVRVWVWGCGCEDVRIQVAHQDTTMNTVCHTPSHREEGSGQKMNHNGGRKH